MIEKFVIRLPKGLRNTIKHLSEQNHRSLNYEIIMVLEKLSQQNLADMASEFAGRKETGLSGTVWRFCSGSINM